MPPSVNVSECIYEVSEMENQIIYDLTEALKEDSRYRLDTQCMLEKLRSFEIVKYFMLKFVHVQDSSMTKLELTSALTAAETSIEAKIDLTFRLCAPEQSFGAIFDDAIQNNEDKSSLSESLNSCIETLLIFSNHSSNATEQRESEEKDEWELIELILNECSVKLTQYNEEKIQKLSEVFTSGLFGMNLTSFEEDCISSTVRHKYLIRHTSRGLKILAYHLETGLRENFILNMKMLFEEVLDCIGRTVLTFSPDDDYENNPFYGEDDETETY